MIDGALYKYKIIYFLLSNYLYFSKIFLIMMNCFINVIFNCHSGKHMKLGNTDGV